MGKCGFCGSSNVYGLSRVVGYYSIIENWNESKQAELQDRQKGFYKIYNKEGQLIHTINKKEALNDDNKQPIRKI